MLGLLRIVNPVLGFMKQGRLRFVPLASIRPIGQRAPMSALAMNLLLTIETPLSHEQTLSDIPSHTWKRPRAQFPLYRETLW